MIGLKLFERVRDHSPTVQGLRLFAEECKGTRSWYGLDRIVATREFSSRFARENCLLPACQSFSQSFLPQLLQPFLARYPDVSLNIVPQESPLLEEALSGQRHDLGFTETLHRLRKQNVPNYSLR